MYHLIMHRIATRLGFIAYESHGEGPPLILLHANPGDRRDFAAVIPELARGFRVHALDWPGYGESPAPEPPARASAMAYADALEDFVAALAAGPAIFVGNSVGGFAAARLAITRPEAVRALVLVGSGGFTSVNAITRLFCRIKGSERVTRAVAGRFARYYLRARTADTAPILARADEERGVPWRVAVDAAIWRSFADPDHDLRARAAAIVAPTLLVWGARDPVLPLAKDGRNAERAIPGAELVALPTGHEPFAEDPPAFLAAVQPFLARVLARRAA
jgi:pimeloyl-ACP methyl ester carboxylesterase